MSAETVIALMLAANAALSLGVAALWLTGRVYTVVIAYLGMVIYALA